MNRLLILLFLLSLASCWIDISKEDEEKNITKKTNDEITKVFEEDINVDNKVKIVKDDLNDNDNIKDNTTNNLNKIEFYDNEFSFSWDIDKIKPHWIDWTENFFYNWLEVSKTFKWPYRYGEADIENISFSCDWSLILWKWVDWEYCETNWVDFLSQFEFSPADWIGFATWGELDEQWYKLYIKKINEINYIFIGKIWDRLDIKPWLCDEEKSSKCHNSEEDINNYNEYIKERDYISSKNYLDKILENSLNKEKIKDWDIFVNSFDIIEN